VGKKQKKDKKIKKQNKKKSMWRGESYSTLPTPFRVLLMIATITIAEYLFDQCIFFLPLKTKTKMHNKIFLKKLENKIKYSK